MEVVFKPQPEDRFDVVIKSSDDKLLNLHSSVLMHHSRSVVFRAIEDLGATKEPIAMEYTAVDLAYFFGLMYGGVQRSTLDDMYTPSVTFNAPIDSAFRLTIQYNCPSIAAVLLGVCNVQANTAPIMASLMAANRACTLINMGHGFGLVDLVDDLLEALASLAFDTSLCTKFKIVPASFEDLSGPLSKLLFAKYFRIICANQRIPAPDTRKRQAIGPRGYINM